MYKGDVTPEEACKAAVENQNSWIVDVRTTPEWAFVGIPDVQRLVRLSWQVFPAMEVDHRFDEGIERSGIGKDDHIYFLCRSGVRSAHAAAHMTKLGYTNCYNIAGGFEGDKDHEQHRGTVNGWKVAGLPWIQS